MIIGLKIVTLRRETTYFIKLNILTGYFFIMNYLKHGMILAGAVTLLTACVSEAPWEGPAGQGGIALRLTASDEVLEARTRTRADEEGGLFVVPDVNDFSIELTKIGVPIGTVWPTLADFQAEEGFATGAYTLRAFYGDPAIQGFGCPAFEGSTTLTVLEGRETSVDLTASLSNTLVSVEYTDEFRKYFSSYSVALTSEGHSDAVTYGADETRPAFMAPGRQTLVVDFTRGGSQNARLEAASFAAEAGHHYTVTLDVHDGNVGDAVFSVVFDDSLTEENVEIDLTDELFTTQAPQITSEGFVSGEGLDVMAYSSVDNALEMTVMGKGGIRSAVLTTESTTWTPPFGASVDLCGASAELRSQLEGCGISAVGLYTNPDRMAKVMLTALPEHLPEGRHAFTLTVTDVLGRISEPVTLILDSSPVSVTATAQGMTFGEGQAVVMVEYNGTNPQANITFEAMDENGRYQPAAVLSCVEQTRTRALDARTYAFTIEMPHSTRENIPVRVLHNGVNVADLNIAVSYPEYTVETDAMATSLRVRVSAADDVTRKAVAENLRVMLSGGTVGSLTRDAENGMVTVTGLSAGTAYTAGLTVRPGNDPTIEHEVSFTTEAAADVPNGDFSDIYETVNTGVITAGGDYKITIIGTNRNKSSVVASEPREWASVNQKTCYVGAAVKNTWFMVTSTYADNGRMVLRNVAYDHNGTLPETDSKGAAGLGKYWSSKAPESFASRAAGELFLGSYTFAGGVETRNEGLAFASRPSSLSFEYSYVPDGDDRATVSVMVLGEGGEVLSSADRVLEASAGMTSVTVTLPATYPFGRKASMLKVGFKSSDRGDDAPVTVPSGDALKDISNTAAGGGITIAANAYKSLATGSVLTLDNVKLNY